MPNDLLELNLEQVNAVVAGYMEREIDAESHCILTGYYAGYYMGAKRPKKPGELIKRLVKSRDKLLGKNTSGSKDEPDIEFFKAMESKFARSRLRELVNDGEKVE